MANTPPTPLRGDWRDLAAGLGKSFVDPYERAKQALGYSSQDDVDEQSRLDQPLMNSGRGLVGYGAGSILQATPIARGLGAAAKAAPFLTKALPSGARALSGLGSVATAAGTGAAQGAATPVTSDQSAAGNIAGGAGAGALGQVISSGLVRAITPAARFASPYLQSLAHRAEQMGIPVTADQLTDSAVGRAVGKFARALPFSGGHAIEEEQRRQLTRNVTSTFGPAEDDAVKAVGNAKRELGSQFDDISGNNMLTMTNSDIQKVLQVAEDNAARGGSAHGELEKFAQNVVKQHTDVHEGLTPGEIYQDWRSTAGKNQMSAGAGSVNADSWNQMQKTLDDAMRRSLGPAEANDWDFLRYQYGNMKDVEKMLPVKGEGFTSGTLDPEKVAARMAAPTAKNGANATAMQQGANSGDPLADAAQVGNAFVPRPPAADASGHAIPGASILKAFGPQVAGVAGGAASGYGISHLAPEDSALHKNPLYAALAGAGASSAMGATLGRYLLSNAYKKGLPATVNLLEGIGDKGVRGSSALPTIMRTANAASGPTQSKAGPADKSPFSGLQEVPEEDLGTASAGPKEVPPEDQ